MLLDKNSYLIRLMVVLSVLGISIWFFTPQPASAQPSGACNKDTLTRFWSDQYGQIPSNADHNCACLTKLEWERIAKAQADECFYGVGDSRNIASFIANYPGDLDDIEKAQCIASGGLQPKVNQAYVWGLVKEGDNLWFGTIANTHCLVISGVFSTAPNLNSSWVCEGGAKDARPPRVFYYDLNDKKLNEVTQKIIAGGGGPLLQTTVGLRSAGAARGVVYVGGISALFGGGVNIFAFDGANKNYLGATTLPSYNNIRQWRTVNNELYVGVGKSTGGEILRWTGTLATPFTYEKVGDILGDPAYLTEHEGRLFVSSWPLLSTGGFSNPMAIWMSPPLGPDGKLTAADALGWTSVWDIFDYEPELASAISTAGGALMSYKGYLYFGTMHVPMTGLLAWQQLNPTAPPEDAAAAVLGLLRPIVILRGKNFGTADQRVELLYGNQNLPKYIPGDGWKIVPNLMGQTPKFGLAGFGNLFNTYTWWMEVYKDQLFVGTFDWSYLVAAIIADEITIPEELAELAKKFLGADLWRFCSTKLPATPVSLNGVGNYTNYGIRTMFSTPGSLYLGTANPMNLLTDPSDNRPEGGWELIALQTQCPSPVTFDKPVLPGGEGATIYGIYQGIDFGDGVWRWEGAWKANNTNHIYFNSSSGKSRTFAFSPGPRVLTSMAVCAGVNGTLTLTDNLGQTKTQAITTGSMQTVTTGWDKASTTIKVYFTAGWELAVDDITFKCP